MNTRLFVAVAVAAGALLWSAPAFAYSSPGNPIEYINDFAQVLSTETKQSLEQELTLFEASTTNQIAVAIVPNMGDDYIENYAVKLFEEWGIGNKKNANGVLLLIAIAERKLRIEVGYGLEGALPDSVAQRIINDEITPKLKAGDYDAAVTAGVHAIQAATKNEYVASATTPNVGQLFSWLFENGSIIFLVGIVLLQWLAAILGRSKSWWAGGVLGLLGGIGIGWLLSIGFATSLLIAAPLTLLGLIFDFIVSGSFNTHRSSGSTPPWWTGGGGSWGGSSSGGGFGGFGGGSSGGGGASGSW